MLAGGTETTGHRCSPRGANSAYDRQEWNEARARLVLCGEWNKPQERTIPWRTMVRSGYWDIAGVKKGEAATMDAPVEKWKRKRTGRHRRGW